MRRFSKSVRYNTLNLPPCSLSSGYFGDRRAAKSRDFPRVQATGERTYARGAAEYLRLARGDNTSRSGLLAILRNTKKSAARVYILGSAGALMSSSRARWLGSRDDEEDSSPASLTGQGRRAEPSLHMQPKRRCSFPFSLFLSY